MNRNTVILGTIGLILVAAVVAYGLVASRQNANQQTNTQTLDFGNPLDNINPNTSTVTTTPTTVTPQQHMTIGTFNGGSIQTLDFLHDPDTVADPINKGFYYLDSGPDNQQYNIEYIASGTYFNISLLSEPIGPARVLAERYLINHLGISAEQMCILKYTVSVPVSVDQKHAGVDLGFSFCPTSVPLGSN